MRSRHSNREVSLKRHIARLVPVAAILLVALSAASALAGSINEVKGIAILGYDPVAYFTVGKPVKGLAKYTAKLEGATFQFATAANRDSFVANTDKYAPKYGGFCAYGTSRGYKAAIDPTAFTIVDGHLYLNFNPDVKKTWSQDIPGYIEKADKNWPDVQKTEKVFR